MKVDSHHNFWNYDPVKYDSVDDAMRIIRHNFAPEDLQRVTSEAGVDGRVSVWPCKVR